MNVRFNRYSVPVAFIGRQVKVLLHSRELLVFADRQLIARHEQLIATLWPEFLLPRLNPGVGPAPWHARSKPTRLWNGIGDWRC
ncbi:hypothetical protein ACFPOI_10580 [Nonomuraea angiospora]|uniref:Mu transposase domain-containing protein n=1 Tax=Nonomuraea angiospora TaxID=46172 RepID=UPI0036198F97